MVKLWTGLLLLGFVSARHEGYDGYALYSAKVQSVEQASFFNSLADQLNLDVWVHSSPARDGIVLVPKNLQLFFQNELYAAGIKHKIEVQNIKEMLDLEDTLMKTNNHKTNNNTGLPFDRIYTYSEVDDYLESLATAHPIVVTLVNAGKSFEGRDIKYVKISSTQFQLIANKRADMPPDSKWSPSPMAMSSTKGITDAFPANKEGKRKVVWLLTQDPNKPIVFMQSLIHAREWITLPVTLYAIHKLVIDVTENHMARDVDWIILPIANPDGYEYSHKKFRFWRKNRSTGNIIANICVGVDLNRNYDINWSVTSSKIPCSETFHGRSPFSEPETAITRDILAKHGDRIKLFLDVHSFGSMILYGYGTGELPDNDKTINLLGVKMAEAIDEVKLKWNPKYTVGNVADVLYQASGSAQDYAQNIGIPFSYTIELPGYKYGLGTLFGFLVDPNFIEKAGMETWEAVKVGAQFILDNFNTSTESYTTMELNAQ